MKEAREVRIRDVVVKETEFYASVDVSLNELGVTMFKYDKLGLNTNSDYISLTRTEAIKLRDLLVEQYK